MNIVISSDEHWLETRDPSGNLRQIRHEMGPIQVHDQFDLSGRPTGFWLDWTRASWETFDNTGMTRIIHPKGGDYIHYIFDKGGRMIGETQPGSA